MIHPATFPTATRRAVAPRNDKSTRATGSGQIWRPAGSVPSPFAQPFECPSLLVVSHRAPRSRQNRLVVESPLIEEYVFATTRYIPDPSLKVKQQILTSKKGLLS